MKKVFSEDSVTRWMVVLLLLVGLLFDRDLAYTYAVMVIADWVFSRTDNKVSLVVERKVDRVKSLTYAFGAYFIFLILIYFLRGVESVVSSGGSVFPTLSTLTPILKGKAIGTFLGWAVIAVIIETRFVFMRLLEGVFDFIGINPLNVRLKDPKVILSILSIASLWTVLHFTSKNLESVPLLITFVFGVMSCILVIKEKQGLAAILFHFLVNGTAVLYTFRPEVFAVIPI